MLILQDQFVEKMWIVALQPFRNPGVFPPDLLYKLKRRSVHVTLRDGQLTPEDAGCDKFFEFFGQVHPCGSGLASREAAPAGLAMSNSLIISRISRLRQG